jgi:Cu/Ag efflux protein CusF
MLNGVKSGLGTSRDQYTFGVRAILALTAILISACAKPTPAAKENQYPMTATIVSRDPAQNSVTLDNKEVPGVMEAMRMDYAVRDAKVNALPPNGTPVSATLHEKDGSYWITGVRPQK